MGHRFQTVHRPQQYGGTGKLEEWVQRVNVDFLAFTNAEIDEVRDLPLHRGFHVVRDPRDVLVSAYFSHLNSHPTDNWPELEEHRAALQSLSKEEGLIKEIEFSRPFLEAMRTWDYDQDHILEVKMENLTGDPDASFRRILRHLGLFDDRGGVLKKLRHYGNRGLRKLHHGVPIAIPFCFSVEASIHPSVLDSILETHRFEKMTGGRSKGEANPESHYRKGTPGDWANHFTDRVARAFEDTYGDIVVRLGYEDRPAKMDTSHAD